MGIEHVTDADVLASVTTAETLIFVHPSDRPVCTANCFLSLPEGRPPKDGPPGRILGGAPAIATFVRFGPAPVRLGSRDGSDCLGAKVLRLHGID
jgi:hypothetical protein